MAFAVSSFYVEQGQTPKADKILEETCQQHIIRFGVEDRHTQQVVLQVVELMNGWNRQVGALAFLGRYKELAEAGGDQDTPKPRRKHQKSKVRVAAPAIDLLDVARELTTGQDPAQIEHRISLARTHVSAKNETVEVLLNAIVRSCDSDNENFEIQGLQARNELLKLYNKLRKSLEKTLVFSVAIQSAEGCIQRHKWNKKNFKGFETLEALLTLAASILRGNLTMRQDRSFKRSRRSLTMILGGTMNALPGPN